MEIGIFTLLILLIVVFAVGALRECRRRGPARDTRARLRENYGPPPGMYRALSHEELDSRGWPEYPLEYTANTASSISHLVERSA